MLHVNILFGQAANIGFFCGEAFIFIFFFLAYGHKPQNIIRPDLYQVGMPGVAEKIIIGAPITAVMPKRPV